MRFLAISIIFADRSIAVMVPPSSFSHTSDTAIPAPAANLQEPVVRLDR